LKACKVVLDGNEKLLSEMFAKSKLKENVKWSECFERNYIEWKTANIKFLNLKVSIVKNKVQGNEFVNFCERKGGKKMRG
jgi:hypothetical protein